jgi:hypothetical protein
LFDGVLATIPVAEAQDGFEIGKTPPSITPGKPPEPIRDTGIETMGLNKPCAICRIERYNGALVISRDCRRCRIGNDGRERACVAVVARDEMQNEVGLLLADRQPCLVLD